MYFMKSIIKSSLMKQTSLIVMNIIVKSDPREFLRWRFSFNVPVEFARWFFTLKVSFNIPVEFSRWEKLYRRICLLWGT